VFLRNESENQIYQRVVTSNK